MRPAVSVIIPSFNSSKYLPQAVNSVLLQTFTDLECIIVDDGSKDNTRQIVKEIAKQDPRVKYFFKKHGGVSAARNFGIKHARGKWIQQLDADDSLHKDKIRFQLGYLNRFHAEEDIVFYSDYEVVWEDLDQNVVKRVVNIIGDLTNEQILERIIKWSGKANMPVHTSNTLFKKTVFEKKMYDVNFQGWEEMELLVDLLLRNVSFIYTPIIGMSYRQHESNTTKNRTLMKYAYVKFLRSICDKDKKLLRLCPNMGDLVKHTIRHRDRKLLENLIEIVNLSHVPVYISKRKININKLFILRLAYFLKLPIPEDHEEIITARVLFRYFGRVISRATRFLS